MLQVTKPQKPFCAFRSGYLNLHIWDKNRQCSAYMFNGKASVRCPVYNKKKQNLDNIVARINDKNNKYDISDIDEHRPAFLRRNTRKVRYHKPESNEKKNTFIDRLQENLKQVQKEYFSVISKHCFHLETYHGFETFTLPSFEPKKLMNSYIDPVERKQPENILDNFNDVESRISQVDRWLEDSVQYESGYVDVDEEIVERRMRRIYRTRAMPDLRQIDSSLPTNDASKNGPVICEVESEQDENKPANSTVPLAIKPSTKRRISTAVTPPSSTKKRKTLGEINKHLKKKSGRLA